MTDEFGESVVSKGQQDSFYFAQKQALKAAKDLRYPKEVVDKLKECTTIGQLSVVMATARQRYL